MLNLMAVTQRAGTRIATWWELEISKKEQLSTLIVKMIYDFILEI